MTERVHHPPNLIYSPGTQVVTLVEVLGQSGKVLHPRGSVGVVVRSPADLDHSYRVRFADGIEESLNRDQVTMLARYKESEIGDTAMTALRCNLYEHVIYRCVIGSQAYGLAGEGSDIDRRGIYLPPADLHWSLYGVPDQLENDDTQEAYWEIQKFLVLALKANPNVLECLYTPMVEKATPLAEKLLAMKSIFLSRMVYQTYNGYVLSQFKKMQADIRNKGQVKWKHVMHLIRLLLSGISIMREGFVPVRVEEHREKLLGIRRGEMPWEEVEDWRKRLHHDFNVASETTKLPERPDYESAKHLWHEACFVPKGTGRENFERIAENLKKEQGKTFFRGFVVKHYVPLQSRGPSPREYPMCEEYRLFFWKRQLLVASHYHRQSENPVDWSPFVNLAQRFDAPFFTMDIAQAEAGDWIVVDMGAGECSSLPPSLEPMRFYRRLAEVTATVLDQFPSSTS